MWEVAGTPTHSDSLREREAARAALLTSRGAKNAEEGREVDKHRADESIAWSTRRRERFELRGDWQSKHALFDELGRRVYCETRSGLRYVRAAFRRRRLSSYVCYLLMHHGLINQS